MNLASNEWKEIVCRTMPEKYRRVFEVYCALQKAVDSLRDIFDMEFTALEDMENNIRTEKDSDCIDL